MSAFTLPFLQKNVSLLHAEDFALFFEQTHRNVFRYVMVLCAGNQAEAEDITAEAFFRAWEKREQFSGSSSAALGWVITIARNLLIDQRRAASTRPIETELTEEINDPQVNIEAMLIGSEQFQQVLQAVDSLPFSHRNIFTLHYVLGWRVKEIAAHLHLTENAVSVDLRRALAKIQKQLTLQEFLAGRVTQ